MICASQLGQQRDHGFRIAAAVGIGLHRGRDCAAVVAGHHVAQMGQQAGRVQVGQRSHVLGIGIGARGHKRHKAEVGVDHRGAAFRHAARLQRGQRLGARGHIAQRRRGHAQTVAHMDRRDLAADGVEVAVGHRVNLQEHITQRMGRGCDHRSRGTALLGQQLRGQFGPVMGRSRQEARAQFADAFRLEVRHRRALLQPIMTQEADRAVIGRKVDREAGRIAHSPAHELKAPFPADQLLDHAQRERGRDQRVIIRDHALQANFQHQVRDLQRGQSFVQPDNAVVGAAVFAHAHIHAQPAHRLAHRRFVDGPEGQQLRRAEAGIVQVGHRLVQGLHDQQIARARGLALRQPARVLTAHHRMGDKPHQIVRLVVHIAAGGQHRGRPQIILGHTVGQQPRCLVHHPVGRGAAQPLHQSIHYLRIGLHCAGEHRRTVS